MSSGRFRLRRILFRTLLIALVAYVIWDRVEAYRLSRTIAAIAARGEPVRYGEALPEPRTDEQRQASNLYAQAASFAREQAAEDNNRAARLDVDNPGGTELSLPDMIAAYRPDASAMQALDQATPLDFGGFDAADRGTREYELSQLASLAFLRADLAAAQGDGEGAAAALVAAVRLQRTLNSTINRSSHAVRVLGSLRILLRHTQPSDKALTALQRAFDSWPDEDRMLAELLQERARFIEIAEDGMEPFAPAAARFLLQPFAIRSGRVGIAAFEPVIALARLPLAERTATMQRADAAYRPQPLWRYRLFGALFDPFPVAYAGMGLSRAKQELAARRVAVAGLAAERFRRAHAGAAPDSLAALVPAFLGAVPEDPMSMKPLVYRRDAGGYILYSVDANRKDDGGELYGHGAAIARHVGPQSPRDLGIRVPLSVARH
jgi:hypothetical protein